MKKIPELHLKAIAAVKDFQKAESSLLKIIQEVDQAKVFLEMGYSSLFLYLTEALKLSEGQAYAYSTVSRKSREVPALQIAVENGLSLYKAQRIVSVINTENQEEWISKAKELPKAKLEMEVAAISPLPRRKESARAVTHDRVSVKVEISAELQQKLKRAQTLLINKKKKNQSLEETLETLIDSYLEKEDPVIKAERASKRKRALRLESPEAVPYAEYSIPNPEYGKILRPGKVIRRNIPAPIKHQVFLRDRGKCSFKGINGKVCNSQTHLEIHHLKPWGIGGTHQLENLQTLCRSHHHLRH